MLPDLFKKDKYPIRLETVRAAKTVLYKTISYDIELLNGYYGIFPEGFAGGLLHDLKQLIGTDIAGEFRLAFYDPVDPEKVYLERSYRLINGKKNAASFPFIKKHPLPRLYEFDVFVYFSDPFLALDRGERARLMSGFNFRWFNFSDGSNGQNAGMDLLLPTPDDNSASRSAFRSSSHAQLSDQFKKVDIPDSDYALAGDAGAQDRPDMLAAPNMDDTGDIGLPLPPAVARDGERTLQRFAAPPLSAEDGALLKQFASDNSLFIAAYTDSRKLIERFTRVSAQLGLIPLQWTFSDGFREIGDKYAGKYLISDDYLLHAKLSPLDALGVIRNE